MSTLNVIERSKNLVHLAFTQDPNVVRFRVLVARTLDNAYVGQAASPLNGVVGTDGTDPIITTDQGADFISTRLRRKRLGIIEESNRGLTMVKYDPDEFVGATRPSAPPDQDFAFMRFQEWRHATGAFGAEGPIHIVPNSRFYTVPQPGITISGTAPDIAGTAAGVNPLPGSMVIIHPKFMGSFTLTNTDGAASLFVSFDRGMPMREVLPSDTVWSDSHTEAMVVAAVGANPTFSLFGAIQNAER